MFTETFFLPDTKHCTNKLEVLQVTNTAVWCPSGHASTILWTRRQVGREDGSHQRVERSHNGPIPRHWRTPAGRLRTTENDLNFLNIGLTMPHDGEHKIDRIALKQWSSYTGPMQLMMMMMMMMMRFDTSSDVLQSYH